MDKTERIKEILGLRRTPIKVGFFDQPPPGIERWAGGPAPAGCFFWTKAMEGKAFFTVPADHYNCAIGSYTHKIGLPADRASELDSTLGFMIETRYLDRAEIPGIPTLDRDPGGDRLRAGRAPRIPGRRGRAGGDAGAVDAGVRSGAEGRHRADGQRRVQPPELRDPPVFQAAGSAGAVVRVQGEPHLHRPPRRGDVRLACRAHAGTR